ncbi:MAG: exodeoxyribonuclease VII small subunit [Phycisphaerales bacterium]|nr:exodeoxyribonuclease VII small subunit [Phycisphaerales bacterium]
MPKPTANRDDELSFEQALEQLEALIDRIESGEIGLEDAIKAYERGLALRQRCEEVLAQAEQRISYLNPSKPAAAQADEDSPPTGPAGHRGRRGSPPAASSASEDDVEPAPF